MGMEHTSEMVIGFVACQDEILKYFELTTPEVSHIEDRYDPKTGKRLKPVVVVDEEERTVYRVDGETYEDSYDIAEALADAVGCRVTRHGNLFTGEDIVFAIEPSKMPSTVSFKQIAELEPECKRIRKEFKKRWGIELGEPSVTSVDSYG